jgi:hypothetical protein
VTARDRLIITIVALVGLVVGAWLLVIEPKRNEASKLGGQIATAQNQLAAARALVAQGEAARDAFAANYTELARLGEAVPPNDNVPSLIYQLQDAASRTHVDFRTLSVGGSTTGAPPASAASSASSALPPGTTVGPAGFPTEPFTFTFQGNFFHLASFFGRLERFVVANNNKVSVSGRLMTLNAISLGAAPQGFPQITASISATTYLVPASQGLEAGATPAGPGATSGQPVSSSASSSSTPTPAAVATPPAP